MSFDDESSSSSSSTGIGSASAAGMASSHGSCPFSEISKREVRVSPANVDLLFKLFENVEQVDRRRKLHLKFKSNKHMR